MEYIITFINIIFLIILPFITLGIINKTKAFWGGRKGASIFQPLYDFLKLLKKESVISADTTILFKIAPIILLATTIFAGLFIPMATGKAVIETNCGFIIFAYILGLGKFLSIIAAMDTGSSFEGMGASREACFTTLVEPAFFVLMASIGVITGNLSFVGFSELFKSTGIYEYLIIGLCIFALLIMILTECCRVPVDDPNTHLELTMIHEVMVLDNSGIDLAIITWATGIKMILLSSLIANLLIPQEINIILSIFLYFAIIIVIGIIIGTIESAVARLRMFHVFEFVFAMTPLALVALSIAAISLFGGNV